MGNNFDPFSGGGNFDSYNYSDDKKPSSKNKIITLVLVILLFGIGIYYAINFLFLNYTEVSFNVTNTEGEAISSIIRISNDKLISNVTHTLSGAETIRLKQREHYYSVQSAGYASFNGTLNLKNQNTTKIEPVVLEKNVSLTIDSIFFPEKVYVGQNAVLTINYENTSINKTYTLDDIVIEGDIKDWDFIALDPFLDPIDKENVLLLPTTKSAINLGYIVSDNDNKNNNIIVRVKYKKDSKNRSFEIIEEPNVPITIDLSGEIKSGESKNYNLTINNSNNKIAITDLIISLDVNGTNEDVYSWFTYPEGNILIRASRNETKRIIVTVPQTAKDDTLDGKLIISSSMFKEDKEFPININIKEPTINFTTSTNKKEVKLKFDVNKNFSNVDYVTLTLDNKSTIDIDLINIETLNLDSDDCNNFVFIPENAIPNMRVNRNTKPDILLRIEVIDPSLITGLINNIRVCNVVVEYKHPFRPLESNIISNNITISVEEK